MSFAQKMMGYPSDLVSFSTKLPSKDMRKSKSHFLQVKKFCRGKRHEPVLYCVYYAYNVKNVIRIFSCLLYASMAVNETKYEENPIIFLANALEIPWLDLVHNPCHVSAWKTNETWINDMEYSRNLVWILAKLPEICDRIWHGILMRIHVIFFA